MLDVRAPTEEESDDSKDGFYGELEKVIDYFPKYNMKTVRRQ
jgi:hypothetical protein